MKTANPVTKIRLGPEQVAHPSGQQQQPAEGDQVGVDDPGQRRWEKCRSRWMVGRATFTTVASSTIMS